MPTVAQQLATIRANQTQIIIPALDRIDENVKQSLQQLGLIMSALTDLQAADAAIKAAIASAVTLIESLHTGAGSVTDAEVEAVVSDLNAAASALSGATPQP